MDEMKPIRPIRTEIDYRNTLAEVENLIALDPPKDSEAGNRLSVLAILVQEFERNRFAISLPTPIEAINFRMGELGLRQKDLVPFLGSKGKVSEILAGKRSLSISMIRAISTGLSIPAKVLLQEQTVSKENPKTKSRLKSFMREVNNRG